MIKGRVGMIIAVVSVEYTQTHISMHISFGSIAVYSEAAFDISLLFPYFFRSSRRFQLLQPKNMHSQC